MVEATCSAFRPDGSAVAFGTISGTICLFDPVEPASPSRRPPTRRTRSGGCGSRPTARRSTRGRRDWFAWDVATGKQTRVTNTGWNYGEPLSPDGKLHRRSVWYTGARPAGSNDDGTRFEIRDAATGEVVHSHPGTAFQGMSWKDFTPDGKAVVGGLPDGTLRVWAIDTGKELFSLPGHKAASQYHAFSADGRVLVTGCVRRRGGVPGPRVRPEGRARSWRSSTPGLCVVGVAVSGDGRRVAAATSANARGMPDPREVAVVWDVASGKVLARVPQKREGKFVALSPDGRLLAVRVGLGGRRPRPRGRVGRRAVHLPPRRPADGAAVRPGRPHARRREQGGADLPVGCGRGHCAPGPPAWDAAAANRVWDELASKDGAKAFAAIRLLRANPDKAVPFLKERTKLPTVPENLKQLLADLGSEDFATREKATDALGGAG